MHAYIRVHRQTDPSLCLYAYMHARMHMHGGAALAPQQLLPLSFEAVCCLSMHSFTHMYTHTQMQTCAVGVFK
jgi:hypothetical protein